MKKNFLLLTASFLTGISLFSAPLKADAAPISVIRYCPSGNCNGVGPDISCNTAPWSCGSESSCLPDSIQSILDQAMTGDCPVNIIPVQKTGNCYELQDNSYIPNFLESFVSGSSNNGCNQKNDCPSAPVNQTEKNQDVNTVTNVTPNYASDEAVVQSAPVSEPVNSPENITQTTSKPDTPAASVPETGKPAAVKQSVAENATNMTTCQNSSQTANKTCTNGGLAIIKKSLCPDITNTFSGMSDCKRMVNNLNNYCNLNICYLYHESEKNTSDQNAFDQNTPNQFIPDQNHSDVNHSDTNDSVQIPSDQGNTASNSLQDESNAYHAYVLRVLELVNNERQKAGLKPVTLDADVTAAAQKRALEIRTSFSHTRPDNTSCFTALKETGVSYRGAGENIAYGQKSPEDVMTGWMNSSGHRANILNASFTKLGVGYYQDARGVNYWTQMFIY